MVLNLWNLLCRSIAVDQETNLISYLNCVSSLRFTKLPTVMPSLNLGTAWLVFPEPGKTVDLQIKISLLDPDGKAHPVFETPTTNLTKKNTERINFKIQGIPITIAGIYRFKIEYFNGLEWNKTSDVLLNVELRERK